MKNVHIITHFFIKYTNKIKFSSVQENKLSFMKIFIIQILTVFIDEYFHKYSILIQLNKTFVFLLKKVILLQTVS